MSDNKPYRNFKKREPSLTTEQKVEQFVIRNSKNSFFTKVSTISHKFDVSPDMAWSIVGELLSSGLFDSIHDEYTGEMKLCETGKVYIIKDMEIKKEYGEKILSEIIKSAQQTRTRLICTMKYLIDSSSR